MFFKYCSLGWLLQAFYAESDESSVDFLVLCSLLYLSILIPFLWGVQLWRLLVGVRPWLVSSVCPRVLCSIPALHELVQRNVVCALCRRMVVAAGVADMPCLLSAQVRIPEAGVQLAVSVPQVVIVAEGALGFGGLWPHGLRNHSISNS